MVDIVKVSKELIPLMKEVDKPLSVLVHSGPSIAFFAICLEYPVTAEGEDLGQAVVNMLSKLVHYLTYGTSGKSPAPRQPANGVYWNAYKKATDIDSSRVAGDLSEHVAMKGIPSKDLQALFRDLRFKKFDQPIENLDMALV